MLIEAFPHRNVFEMETFGVVTVRVGALGKHAPAPRPNMVPPPETLKPPALSREAEFVSK